MSRSKWMALPSEGKGHTLRPTNSKHRKDAAFTKMDAITDGELLLAVALQNWVLKTLWGWNSSSNVVWLLHCSLDLYIVALAIAKLTEYCMINFTSTFTVSLCKKLKLSWVSSKGFSQQVTSVGDIIVIPPTAVADIVAYHRIIIIDVEFDM